MRYLVDTSAVIKYLTLVADNDKDFQKITGLKYINPGTLNSSDDAKDFD